VTRDAEAAEAAVVADGGGANSQRFSDEVVLITGFPGRRAAALVRLLCEREPDAALWLVVPEGELERASRLLGELAIAPERLRVIQGEPCAIDLGLSSGAYAELAQHVDRVFALYQTADSHAPRELVFRTNLGSARELVEFSRVARSLSQVTFLSSYAVFGDFTGQALEDQLAVGQGFRSPAAQSLAAAEALLQRSLAELPVSVVRTPQVVYRAQGSVSGSTLHQLLGLVAHAPGSLLPLPPGAGRTVHALPVDFVAEALYLVSALGIRGHAYHFADPEPPTLAEVIEQAARHFGKQVQQGFDARSLGRLLLNAPGFWFSPHSSRLLSEWTDGPRLATRAGDRLLERGGLRSPSLLSYLTDLLRETEQLPSESAPLERPATTPFEVVA
jgi:Male sterility protein